MRRYDRTAQHRQDKRAPHSAVHPPRRFIWHKLLADKIVNKGKLPEKHLAADRVGGNEGGARHEQKHAKLRQRRRHKQQQIFLTALLREEREAKQDQHDVKADGHKVQNKPEILHIL
ncbi:hypothetical protein SDC9_69109 [bioreactor metagenome]|uniref:Uncharacterized protein n=1 Tax=bioreactor metagenome TaxID=1076179 RepID=A0A644Y412_9ZZZZ